ncbi:hypothetical protein AVEN_95409-1 [Araneus ventricosus]|uniref:Uncharacterized protein n=1 Tax=Araneus ventricosus TaxID=182803 RepID=A0A4Y2CIF3_ARAVE|nr:hypothetical protein AVEN_95409-1 [Araneus ventricosus]
MAAAGRSRVGGCDVTCIRSISTRCRQHSYDIVLHSVIMTSWWRYRKLSCAIENSHHWPRSNPSRRRYVPSSEWGNSTHTITMSIIHQGKEYPLTYPTTSHPLTHGAPHRRRNEILPKVASIVSHCPEDIFFKCISTFSMVIEIQT